MFLFRVVFRRLDLFELFISFTFPFVHPCLFIFITSDKLSATFYHYILLYVIRFHCLQKFQYKTLTKEWSVIKQTQESGICMFKVCH